MKQLTVRLFEPELQRRIEQLAEREHLSLNQAVLKLLRRSVGLGPDSSEKIPIGEDIDRFAGTWTAAEAQEFDEAIEVFERIDEEFWK